MFGSKRRQRERQQRIQSRMLANRERTRIKAEFAMWESDPVDYWAELSDETLIQNLILVDVHEDFWAGEAKFLNDRFAAALMSEYRRREKEKEEMSK